MRFSIFPFIGEILDDPDLSDGERITAGKILRACWNTDAEKFDWLEPQSYTSLATLINMDRRLCWRHCQKLFDKNYFIIRWPVEGVFQLCPNYNSLSPQSDVSLKSDSRRSKTTIINRDSFKESSFKRVDESNKKEPSSESDNLPEFVASYIPPDRDLIKYLNSKGVLNPTAARIAAKPDITFEIAKAQIEAGELLGQPVNYAIRRLLDGAPVPDISDAICEYCGKTKGGEHGEVAVLLPPDTTESPEPERWAVITTPCGETSKEGGGYLFSLLKVVAHMMLPSTPDNVKQLEDLANNANNHFEKDFHHQK
jgi:hypothetical protein